jgi:class 3 adenylate cyclase
METIRSATKSYMLNEEFKAEKLLAFIRLGIVVGVAASHLLALVLLELPFSVVMERSVLLIDGILILLAALFVVDLQILYHRMSRMYRPWYRYVMATADIALVAGIAYGLVEYGPFADYSAPVAVLGAFALILVFVSTVRFDPFNSLYLGLAYAVIFVIVEKSIGMEILMLPAAGLFSAGGAIAALLAAHLRSKIRTVNDSLFLTRFLPNNFAEQVTDNPAILDSGGETRYVTVLFTDIRNFTGFSERHSPEQVVEYINEFFNVMVDTVFRRGGTLDKFVGDAVMAVYGAPFSSGQDEHDAVATAVEMVRSLEDLNDRLAERGYPPVRIGCGIASGYVVAGNVGNESRMEYTVLGDTVNLASRLEGLNKRWGSTILVTDRVCRAVEGQFRFGRREQTRIRGREEPVDVAEVLPNTAAPEPG